MGTGGAPEGVLTAAALRCLNGEIQARLVVAKPEHEERLAKMGIKDAKRIYKTEDLARGKEDHFACTGVTDGNLLRGVRFLRRRHSHAITHCYARRAIRCCRHCNSRGSSDVKVRFA